MIAAAVCNVAGTLCIALPRCYIPSDIVVVKQGWSQHFLCGMAMDDDLVSMLARMEGGRGMCSLPRNAWKLEHLWHYKNP